MVLCLGRGSLGCEGLRWAHGPFLGLEPSLWWHGQWPMILHQFSRAQLVKLFFAWMIMGQQNVHETQNGWNQITWFKPMQFEMVENRKFQNFPLQLDLTPWTPVHLVHEEVPFGLICLILTTICFDTYKIRTCTWQPLLHKCN